MKLIIVRFLKLTIAISLFFCKSVSGQNQILHFTPGSQAVALGGSLVTQAFDPSAIYWNPACMPYSKNQEVLINVSEPFSFNYVGLTRFFPLLGTFGLSLSKISGNYETWEVGTIAWGNTAPLGISWGANLNLLQNGRESVYTMGLSLLVVSTVRSKTTSSNWWNYLLSKGKLNLGASLQNIPMGKVGSDPGLKLGFSYEVPPGGLLINFGYHTDTADNSSHLGLRLPLGKGIRIYSGIEEFVVKRSAFGAGFQGSRFTLDLVYSLSQEKLMVSLVLNLGKDIQDLAKHYFETGITRIKGGDHRAALSDFKKSLAYNPDNQTVDKLVTFLEKKIHTEDKKIDSLLAEGINFQKRQWYISATLCYLQILELNPGHKKAQKNIKLIKPMVDVYIEKTYQGGVNYFEQGEYHQAREVFKRVLSLRKDHEGAKRYLQQIEDIFTTAAQDHFIRGLGYYSQKNLEKAREEFTNALKYDPQSEEIKQHLEKVEAEILEVEARVKKLLKEAEILEKKGQYVKASLKYNEVLQLDKNNRLATENLQKIQKYVEVYVRNKYREGETLFNNQDLRGAERAFKDLLSVSPNHRQAKLYLDRIQASIAQESAGHYEAGLKYYADRRWEKASDEFEKVLEIDPGHKEAAKKREEALSLMSLESLLKKARTYYANKDYLKALEAFHQMLESHPNNSQAQEYIEKCQQQLNQMVEEYFNVGMAYYTEENYEAALREWDKVLKINPDHRGALEYRKRALERVQALQELP